MRPRLVLLHGWAVNSLIWFPIIGRLNSRYEVIILDLPGYGSQSDYSGQYDLDSVVADVLSRAPLVANWVGWSLGGTVALAAALAQPHRFQKLQLVSTTPKFLTSEDWKLGVEAEPFEELSAGFEADYFKALKKFLLLQTFTNDPGEKKKSVALAQELRALLAQANPPSQQTLQSGLEILRQTDLRDQIGQLSVETQVITGESDRIVPAVASKHLYDELTHGLSYKSLPGGHLPFLQSSSDYIEALEQFIPTDHAGA